MLKMSVLYGSAVGSAILLGRYILSEKNDADTFENITIDVMFGLLSAALFIFLVYSIRRYVYKINDYGKYYIEPLRNNANDLVCIFISFIVASSSTLVYYIFIENSASILIDMNISLFIVIGLFMRPFLIMSAAERAILH